MDSCFGRVRPHQNGIANIPGGCFQAPLQMEAPHNKCGKLGCRMRDVMARPDLVLWCVHLAFNAQRGKLEWECKTMYATVFAH